MKNARQILDDLLRETPDAARARERSAFDEIVAGRRKVVIFGAGRLGRKILQGLSGTDLKAVAYADNNSRLWGKTVDGLPVLSPQEAAQQHSADATFIVAIWHPSREPLMAALLTQLMLLACRATSFPLLFWRYPGKFLPHFFWDLPSRLLDQVERIRAAFDLLKDDLSRQAFVGQIQLRLRADFVCIGSPAPGEQYFPNLFSMSADECFVDCGAYTGDTIQSFLGQSSGLFRKVIAFEADPSVLPALETLQIDVGSRIVLYKAAVGAYNGVASFAGDGIGGGCVTEGPGTEVPCVRLDDALAAEHPSFIKMDIEGAEIQALEGAYRVIRQDRPVLAVCGYHRPDHFWRVPLFLKTLAPDSTLFLRTHCADGLDSVFYAVPPERRTTGIRHTLRRSIATKKSRPRTSGSKS